MGLFRNTKRTMVVSLDTILQSKGVRGRAAPRQQLQALRALSRVLQREKVNVTAVVAGKPLNKAPHNKMFDGVRVRYAKESGKTGAEQMKSLKQAGSAGVLITGDTVLETKAIRSGFDTLRPFTFRKLMEDGGELSGGGQNSGGERKNGGRKNRRDRSLHPEHKKQRRPKANKKTQEQDEISQMIDLVE